jgi:hypothetical protein
MACILAQTRRCCITLHRDAACKSASSIDGGNGPEHTSPSSRGALPPCFHPDQGECHACANHCSRVGRLKAWVAKLLFFLFSSRFPFAVVRAVTAVSRMR